MKELLKKDWQYILFEDEEDLLLKVICGSVAIFELNIKLNDLEKTNFQLLGEEYIDKLAHEISSNYTKYQSRSIPLS
ncbi:MAG: hypothetical protein AAFQ94_31235 [Bacteroidota bacterium]